MAKKPMKKTKKTVPKQTVTPPITAPEVNASEVIKERLKQANKGGLLDMMGQIKNTTPEEWKNPEKVKDLAKKLATQFKMPVSEERLDQFMKAYEDATKGGQPKDPDQLIKKYGQGIDEKSINEMKKFIK